MSPFSVDPVAHIPPRKPIDLNPPPLLTGDDLKALGIAQGPIFKRLLDAVRDAQLDGTIRTPEEAMELVKRLLEEMNKA